MIKTRIEVKGKIHSYLIPDNWMEVSLKDLIKLELWLDSGKATDRDPVGLLSCFIDLDTEIIANSKRDHWAELLTVLAFVFQDPGWDGLRVPKTIEIDNKIVKVPKKLELERFGQKVLCWQYMAKMDPESKNIAIIPDVMAVYFQPLIDGKFSRLRLDYAKRQLLDLPAFRTVPIGRFFFRKLQKLNNYGWIGLKQSRLIVKKILHSRRRAEIS